MIWIKNIVVISKTNKKKNYGRNHEQYLFIISVVMRSGAN